MDRMFVAAAFAALALPGMASANEKPNPNPEGEAALAALVDSRVATEVVGCLPTPAAVSVVDGTAIVFRRGNKLYINRPRSGAETMANAAPLRKVYGSQLCSGDPLDLMDRTSLSRTGFVLLGDFVRYENVRTSAR